MKNKLFLTLCLVLAVGSSLSMVRCGPGLGGKSIEASAAGSKM